MSPENAMQDKYDAHDKAMSDLEFRLTQSEASAAAMRESLDTLTMVIGLTPIAGNKEALQEALDLARKAVLSSSSGSALLLRLQQAEARLTNTEDLISPTDSNVQYWTQRIMDEIEEGFTSQRISQVIRELLKNDTQASANENALDMFRDEFKRIKACPDVSDEVKGLCDRAIQGIESRVPLIKQIERAEAEILEYKSAILKIDAVYGNPTSTPDSLVNDLLRENEKLRISTVPLELAQGLRDALENLVNGVQEWCDDVDRDASWDGWDSNYKHFAHGGLNAPREAIAAFDAATKKGENTQVEPRHHE